MNKQCSCSKAVFVRLGHPLLAAISETSFLSKMVSYILAKFSLISGRIKRLNTDLGEIDLSTIHYNLEARGNWLFSFTIATSAVNTYVRTYLLHLFPSFRGS